MNARNPTNGAEDPARWADAARLAEGRRQGRRRVSSRLGPGPCAHGAEQRAPMKIGGWGGERHRCQSETGVGRVEGSGATRGAGEDRTARASRPRLLEVREDEWVRRWLADCLTKGASQPGA